MQPYTEDDWEFTIISYANFVCHFYSVLKKTHDDKTRPELSNYQMRKLREMDALIVTRYYGKSPEYSLSEWAIDVLELSTPQKASPRAIATGFEAK